MVELGVNVCGTVGIAVAVGSGVSVTVINGSGVSVGPAGDGVSVAGGTGVAVCVVVGNGVMVLVARGVSVIGIDVAVATEVGDETTARVGRRGVGSCVSIGVSDGSTDGVSVRAIVSGESSIVGVDSTGSGVAVVDGSLVAGIMVATMGVVGCIVLESGVV